MPTYLSPGVYVEEFDSGPVPLTGGATAVPAFIGYTAKVPNGDFTPQLVTSWAQYQSLYGNHAKGALLPYSVQGYFNNGGNTAYIVPIDWIQPPRDPKDGLARDAVPQLLTGFRALVAPGAQAEDKPTLTFRAWPKLGKEPLEGQVVVSVEKPSPPEDGEIPDAAFDLRVRVDGKEVEHFAAMTTATVATINKPDAAVTDDKALSNFITVDVAPDIGSLEPRRAHYPLIAPPPVARQVVPNDFNGKLTEDERTGIAALQIYDDVTMLIAPDLYTMARGPKQKVAQAAFDTAQSNLKQALGEAPKERDEAQTAFYQAQYDVEQAQQAVDVAQAAFDQAQQAVKDAQTALDGATTDDEKAEAQAQLAAAKKDLGDKKSGKTKDLNDATADLGDADGGKTKKLADTKAALQQKEDALTAAEETSDAKDAQGRLDTATQLLSKWRDVDVAGWKMVQTAMITHCENQPNRMAILDTPPAIDNPLAAKQWLSTQAMYSSAHAALYYPWIEVANPLYNPDGEDTASVFAGESILVPPSGHMAGVWGRTDSTRGVWKAPANEVVQGALNVDYKMTSGEQEQLNPNGINAIRPFGTYGIRVWGARTLAGNAQWEYIPVRRLFSWVEKTIMDGTNWVVFEPNDQTTWDRVVRTVSNFLIGLWRDGALFGATPADAFYVTCDETTNPPDSIDEGKLVCEIGIAPVKPAEFVIFRVTQWKPE